MKYFFASWWKLGAITGKEIQKEEEMSGKKERKEQGMEDIREKAQRPGRGTHLLTQQH